MMAPALRFVCLSMPNSWILEQSNKLGTNGSIDAVMGLSFCCACMENLSKLNSASKTPAKTMHKVTTMRTLRKAERAVSFFFIDINYGRGCGTGRPLGVGLILGVGLTIGVAVGVAVGVGLALGVIVGVGVGVGVAPDAAQYLPPVFK